MNKYFAIVLLAALAGCKNEGNIPIIAGTPAEKEIVINTSADYERFSGDWYYENPQNGKIESTFALHLQTGNTAIKGYYCAVAQYGNKIDCANDMPADNISGNIKKDTAFVSFTGIYSSKATGKAKLYFENGSLVWQLVQVKGEVYVPEKVLLTMDKPAQTTQLTTNGLPLSGQDIKTLNFREISEDIIELNTYYCGMKPKFYELPMVDKYQVKIISNECGDFPFYALVTTLKGRLTDKRVIYMEDWTNPENEAEKSSVDFTISKDYIITITEKQLVNGKSNEKSRAFSINKESGKIAPVAIRLR